MIEHHIQKEIILRLAKAETLRFSELKPSAMESNAFMYHLKQLQADGYVVQLSDKTYQLTGRGLTYIDFLSIDTGRPRQQPKVISIMMLQNQSGHILLAQRRVQPSIGTWMLPSGKQHFGESPEDHIKREAAQQLGHDVSLLLRGWIDIRVRHSASVVTHLLGRVYAGEYDGPAPADTEKFHYEWHDSSVNVPLTPGTPELLAALENTRDGFLLSLDVTAD